MSTIAKKDNACYADDGEENYSNKLQAGHFVVEGYPLGCFFLTRGYLRHAEVGAYIQGVVKNETGLRIEVYVCKKATTILQFAAFYDILVYARFWYCINNAIVDTEHAAAGFVGSDW